MVPRKQAAHASQGCAANALRHQLELFQAVPLPVDAACQGALVRLQGGEACWRWVRGMQGAGQAGMRATCAQACSHLQLVFSTAAYLPRRAQQARCIASCHVRQARLHSALRGEQGRQGCWGAASELYRTIIYTYTCIYTYTHIYIYMCMCVYATGPLVPASQLPVQLSTRQMQHCTGPHGRTPCEPRRSQECPGPVAPSAHVAVRRQTGGSGAGGGARGRAQAGPATPLA